MKSEKSFLIALFLSLMLTPLRAQNNVAVRISDVNNRALQTAMERNASALLTAINRAESGNTDGINFQGVDISDDAANSLAMLWSNVHIRITSQNISERCVVLRSDKRVRGYEIMNIPLIFKEESNAGTGSTRETSQEATITFDTQGRIADFVISSGIRQYKTLMKDAKSLDDLDKRMQILHFVEQFRTAYCQKDISFMENVFSEDALIITGRVITRRNRETGMTSQIVYDKHTKAQYLQNLSGIFSRCNYVNVKFSDITIERNGAKPHIYGVTCTQDWQAKRRNGVHYEDLGKVFMLWDFSDEDHPVIHVRTWQTTDDPKQFTTKSFRL